MRKSFLLFCLLPFLFGFSSDWWMSPVASSIPFDNATNGFISTDVQAAIEEAREYAQGFPRSGVRSTANGTVGNNDWIGPTELHPDTPTMVFPVNAEVNEISWSNQRTNVEFHLEFRRTSKTGTIFHTLTVVSTNPGYGYVSGLSYVFSAGDVIYVQYKDDGQNCSDFELTLWISRIP